jgi:hypothetical protein
MALRPRSGSSTEPSSKIGVIAPPTSFRPTWKSSGTVSKNSEVSEPGAPVKKSTSNGSAFDTPVR